MLDAGVLSFREWAMKETLPLAVLHEAVLQFLRGRGDIAVCGAHAVNAYVAEPRMTQDIDVLATHADFGRDFVHFSPGGNWSRKTSNRLTMKPTPIGKRLATLTL